MCENESVHSVRAILWMLSYRLCATGCACVLMSYLFFIQKTLAVISMIMYDPALLHHQFRTFHYLEIHCASLFVPSDQILYTRFH